MFQGKKNVMVPIHGYPVMSTADFPRHFTFPVIAIGERHVQYVFIFIPVLVI